MINFLRRIRRNLINENKPSIYLIYALGEVVLVVFGILIALQIDNRNENQKLLRLEKEILGEIKNGLESDYETVSRAIEDHLVYMNSQNIIVDWIDRKYPFHDSLVPHFKHTFWTTLFLPNDAQFESLKQFGIRNISNKELSDRLSHLYDYLYEEILFWQNEYKKTSIDFRSTHDELGFDQDGYNEKGWHRKGFHNKTRGLFDEDGYNKDGFDKDGYNNCKPPWRGRTKTRRSPLGITQELYNQVLPSMSSIWPFIWRERSSFVQMMAGLSGSESRIVSFSELKSIKRIARESLMRLRYC